MELNEQGVYEVRAAAASAGRAERIAVNLDPTESDLSVVDPQELVAAVTGRAGAAASSQQAAADITPTDAERQQGLWWYLLLAGMAPARRPKRPLRIVYRATRDLLRIRPTGRGAWASLS